MKKLLILLLIPFCLYKVKAIEFNIDETTVEDIFKVALNFYENDKISLESDKLNLNFEDNKIKIKMPIKYDLIFKIPLKANISYILEDNTLKLDKAKAFIFNIEDELSDFETIDLSKYLPENLISLRLNNNKLIINVTEMSLDYKDGIYYGKEEGYNGQITTCLTVADGEITSLEVNHQDKVEANQLIEQIKRANYINVDNISGATTTSLAIKKALTDSLEDSSIDKIIPFSEVIQINETFPDIADEVTDLTLVDYHKMTLNVKDNQCVVEGNLGIDSNLNLVFNITKVSTNLPFIGDRTIPIAEVSKYTSLLGFDISQNYRQIQLKQLKEAPKELISITMNNQQFEINYR